ncbi:MAG: hypothetical protein FWG63_08785 [Defluviitaleaceae bacterium]|nr:hypothetical protein [Defluviitaleaceae bacterium]
MKEFKIVNVGEGLKGVKIDFRNKLVHKNINVLAEKYALEGWEVFQLLTSWGDIHKIVFVRDKAV